METWAVNTQARVGHNKATVALANKMARIIWAVRILSWPGGTTATNKGRIHECSRLGQIDSAMWQQGDKE